MMMMSLVTFVPPKVSLFKRKAPITSAEPLVESQFFSVELLSNVFDEVMKTPRPPGLSALTFFAITKSWRSRNSPLRSLFSLS